MTSVCGFINCYNGFLVRTTDNGEAVQVGGKVIWENVCSFLSVVCPRPRTNERRRCLSVAKTGSRYETLVVAGTRTLARRRGHRKVNPAQSILHPRGVHGMDMSEFAALVEADGHWL